MIVYWLMFGFPALAATLTWQRGKPGDLNKLALSLLVIAFVIVIGLRYNVGADWLVYETIMWNISLVDLGTAMFQYGDPGFNLIGWVATRVGAEVWGANFVCGIILVAGLVHFCRQQDDQWLALCAAVPYLVIVVGMGYVRQGAAIGLLLVALVRFERGQVARSLVWIAVAATFHASAVILAPLMAAAVVRKNIALVVPVAIAGGGLFYLLLQSRLDSFYSIYIEAEYDSSGAMVRLLMNAIPGLLMLLFRRRFPGSPVGRALWLWFAVLSLLLVVAVLVSPSTTLIDRVGLYLIPIQVYVFGNLTVGIGVKDRGRLLITVLAIAYYAAILFVWLNYATHSSFWLPYRFLPLEGWPEPFT